ncbi:hypothetical protein BJX99DRAFT_216876 [Aspergillus californicus]
MPSYRIEQAPTSRAGCTNTECKNNKVKITKGELRLGSWVDTEKIQAFFWKHWGCVTPKVISNMQEVVEEGDERDLTLLDGFDELEPELQEKVARALAQGHVDHEDWKGDPEMNEPGKAGFRVRTPKKKAAKATKAAEDEDEEVEEDAEEKKTPTKAAKPRKRTHFNSDEDGNDAETFKPKRPKRKATGYPKKLDLPTTDEDEDEDDEPPVAKATATRRGRQPKEPAATGPKRGKKAKATEEENAEAEPDAEKPKRGRKAKKVNEENTEAEPVAEKPKRGRKKKAT